MGSSKQQRKRKDGKGKKSEEQTCSVFSWWRRNRFLLLLVIATIGGYALGIALQPLAPSALALHLIGFPGQLVLRAFLMIIVPMLFCSLVLGVASLRKGGDARMVALTIGLFLLLSTLSAILGSAAGHLVHPGRKVTTDDGPDSTTVSRERTFTGRKGYILDNMLDLLWNAVPGNVIESTFSKEYTHVEAVNKTSDYGNGSAAVVYRKSMRQTRGINFMGLLTFSILFGSALAVLGDKGQQLHQVVEQLNAVVTAILGYVLTILPVGMFFWMLQEGLQSRAPAQLLGHLGLFLATAFGCIALHQFVLLPLLYVALVRKNPVRYHLNLLPAMLTAFGTASSAATLPLTLRCAEESNRVNRCVTRFVLPLGMVMHMNGGTLYTPLSAIFLAQLEGTEIGIAQTVVMCVTSIILFVSAPATPNAGNPVYLLAVLAAGGIDSPQFISIVLSMEWLMERFRTIMNVVADSYVAAIVEKLCGDRLPPDEDEDYPSPVLRGYDARSIPRQCEEPTRNCRGDIAMADNPV